MKINSIQSYSYKSFLGTQNTRDAEGSKSGEKKKISKSVIGYGVAGLAAIGLATFAIIKSKKSPAKAVEPVVQKIKTAADDTVQKAKDLVIKPVDKADNGELPIPEMEKELNKIADKTPLTSEPVVEPKKVEAEVKTNEPSKVQENTKSEVQTDDAAKIPDDNNVSEKTDINSETIKKEPETELASKQQEDIKNEEHGENNSGIIKNAPEQNDSASVQADVKTDVQAPQNTEPVKAESLPENEVKTDTAVKTDDSQKIQSEVSSETVSSVKFSEAIKSDDFTVTEVEIKPFSYQSVDKTQPPFEGVEKLISVDYNNGTGRTYQRFYHKDKIYETSIYDELTDDSHDILKLTRYNYAYENGKLVGVAKQDVDKDGHQWGIYHDGMFDPFPIMVKMKGDKDFHQAPVYTPDALFELDKRFDPYNF